MNGHPQESLINVMSLNLEDHEFTHTVYVQHHYKHVTCALREMHPQHNLSLSSLALTTPSVFSFPSFILISLTHSLNAFANSCQLLFLSV